MILTMVISSLSTTDTINVDARPSDALNLAVRTHVPILVARDVMDSAGIRPEEDLKDETHLPTEERPAAKLAKTPSANVDESEDRLSIFEDFLEKLDLDEDDQEGSEKKDNE